MGAPRSCSRRRRRRICTLALPPPTRRRGPTRSANCQGSGRASRLSAGRPDASAALAKKIGGCRRKGRVATTSGLEGGGSRNGRSTTRARVRGRGGHQHTSLSPRCACSPKGSGAYAKVPRSRGSNTALLASVNLEGMGPCSAVQEGAATATVFVGAYVEQALAPGPRRGRIVVLADLGARKSERSGKPIEGRGCRLLLFLPPCSPGSFDPTEEAFLEDQGRLARDPSPNPRSPDRGVGGGDLGTRPKGCSGLLRAWRLPSTRPAFVKHAVRGARCRHSSGPTVAREGVEAREWATSPVRTGNRPAARGRDERCLAHYVPSPRLPEASMRARRVRNFGWSRRGANSRACLKCSTSRSPAATAFSM